jgi:uncharacterized protein YegL
MDDSNMLNGVDFTLNFNNFDPGKVQTEEVINLVFVVDVSPSIESFKDELNLAFNEFVAEMQKSHVAENLMVSSVEFCEVVNVKTGFQPIRNIPVMNFQPQGNSTALYDATKVGLTNAIQYREQLEDSGINVKTLVFILTDGMDNSSDRRSAPDVKDMITAYLANEKNAFSFTTILFGIGKANQQHYENAKTAMGIKELATIDLTAKEIRKMIAFISSSISTSAAGKPVSTVNF